MIAAGQLPAPTSLANQSASDCTPFGSLGFELTKSQSFLLTMGPQALADTTQVANLIAAEKSEQPTYISLLMN